MGMLTYYERKNSKECRVVLRKSLHDFKDKNPDLIVQWIIDAIKLFRDKLQTPSVSK